MKLGQFADRSTASTEAAEREKEMADAMAVGSRCEVTVGQTSAKRGTVMFVGKWLRDNAAQTLSFPLIFLLSE